MGQNFYKKNTTAEIEQAFRHFDKDDSGYITVINLKITSCIYI